MAVSCGAGSSSFAIDIPEGGVATISGNQIFQGPATQNNKLIAYGEESLPFDRNRLSMTRRRRLLGQALSQLPRRRRPGEITADLYSARMGRSCSPRLRCHMQLCPDPRRRLVVANPEHTTIRLDPRPSAPPNDERARECGVEEIDRDGIIEYSAHAGRRHRPAIRSTILIEPGRSCENAADQDRPAERQS